MTGEKARPTARAEQAITTRDALTRELMAAFTYDHLPPLLQAVSRPFHGTAVQTVLAVPDGANLWRALERLAEAKDWAVRAAIAAGALGDPAAERPAAPAWTSPDGDDVDFFSRPSPETLPLAAELRAWAATYGDPMRGAVEVLVHSRWLFDDHFVATCVRERTDRPGARWDLPATRLALDAGTLQPTLSQDLDALELAYAIATDRYRLDAISLGSAHAAMQAIARIVKARPCD